MIQRTALFVGTVDPDHSDEFDRTVREEVLPLLRQIPSIRSANVLKTVQQEAGIPEVYQTYMLRFDDMAGMEEMLASEGRVAVHQAMSRILPWFDGHVVHMVAEVH